MERVLLELCKNYSKGELFISKMLSLFLKEPDQNELRERFEIYEEDKDKIKSEVSLENIGRIDIGAGNIGIEVKLWSEIRDNQFKYSEDYSKLFFVIPENSPADKKLKEKSKEYNKIEKIYWSDIKKKLKNDNVWGKEFKELLDYYLGKPADEDFEKIKNWEWYEDENWKNGDSSEWQSMYKIFHYAQSLLPNSSIISPSRSGKKKKYVGFYWSPEDKGPKDGIFWFGIEEEEETELAWNIYLGSEKPEKIKFSDVKNKDEFYEKLYEKLEAFKVIKGR